jgi:hypothetical protein
MGQKQTEEVSPVESPDAFLPEEISVQNVYYEILESAAIFILLKVSIKFTIYLESFGSGIFLFFFFFCSTGA